VWPYRPTDLAEWSGGQAPTRWGGVKVAIGVPRGVRGDRNRNACRAVGHAWIVASGADEHQPILELENGGAQRAVVGAAWRFLPADTLTTRRSWVLIGWVPNSSSPTNRDRDPPPTRHTPRLADCDPFTSELIRASKTTAVRYERDRPAT